MSKMASPGFGASVTERGAEDAEIEAYCICGRQIGPWSLNFPHIFNIFEKNLNGQHEHFTKIFTISKCN